MGVFVSIITGVVSGVLTSALLWILVSLFRDRFVPFWSARQYQGLNLAGSWNAVTITEAEDLELNLVLEQRAHDLSGALRISFKSPTNTFELDHVITGQLWEGYLIIVMKPRIRNITSFGTAMFKVAGGGSALVGRVLYRNVNAEKVDEVPVQLFLRNATDVRSAAMEIRERAGNAKSLGQPGGAQTDKGDGGN